MQRPHLIIIAGCNGAGKSTYSHLLAKGLVPFDYDKRFFEIYNSIRDSEWREQFSYNQTTEELNHLINDAFDNKQSVCFETNLHVFPYDWIEKAKSLDYIIDLHFFCLESIEIAQKRVEIRTKNNGHYVSNDVIDYKWKEGYKNLNLHFTMFDFISFIDNSQDDNIPEFMFELHKESEHEYICIMMVDQLPEYAERRFPNIFSLISDK